MLRRPSSQPRWSVAERFKFPAIRPAIPKVERWAHYLEPSYRARWFSNFGPVVDQFETSLGEQFGHDGEVFTSANNCTTAIAAALIALKVGGPVAIPAFSFPATASAVKMAGAEPCVVDVDLDTWSLGVERLREAFRLRRFEAVVLVVPFGIAQDFAPQIRFCLEQGVAVVIDNASGLGGPTVPLVSERCFEAYSLHATKPFAIGEGGVIRSRASQSEDLRRALNFGLQEGLPQEGMWGLNGKLPEVSAAIGLAVLEDFSDVVRRRQRAAGRYSELFADCQSAKFITDSPRAPWQMFPMLLPRIEEVALCIEAAAKRGLELRRNYRPTLQHWPGTTDLAPCPNARLLADRMISVPVYSDMTDAETEAIAGILRDCLCRAAAA